MAPHRPVIISEFVINLVHEYFSLGLCNLISYLRVGVFLNVDIYCLISVACFFILNFIVLPSEYVYDRLHVLNCFLTSQTEISHLLIILRGPPCDVTNNI